MGYGTGPVVFSSLGLLPICYWLFHPQPKLVLEAVKVVFPFLPFCFYSLIIASVLSLLCALAGNFLQRQGPLKCSAWCSILVVFFALPVGFCFLCTLHMGVRFLWEGIPGVMDHGFPELCHQISHEEVMGKVTVQACDHQCAYSPAELLAPAVQAGLSITFGRTPSRGLGLPEPQTPGVCVSDDEYNMIADYVDNEPTNLSRFLLSITSIILFQLILVCIAYGGEASARELAIVEPLLRHEEEEEGRSFD